MEFYFPTEFGEQLAFSAAAVSAVIGLVMMFAPGVTFRLFGMQFQAERRDGLVLLRSSLAGFYLGFGATALLLAQPMVYLALGAAFALAAFGRILSMLSDSGNTVVNWLYLIVQIVLSALPSAYVFGFI